MESQDRDTFFNLKKRKEAARARPLGFRMLKPRTRWHVLLRRVLDLKHFLSFADLEATNTARRSSARRLGAESGEMPSSDKALLRRPVLERTDDEREILSQLFSGLKCFRGYPEGDVLESAKAKKPETQRVVLHPGCNTTFQHVRKLLASFVSLETYDANRTIVKQGHQPQGMYFVWSGQLDVWHTTTDPVLGEERDFVGILGAGDVFGSDHLLSNSPRNRTIISKTIVELLLLKKHDFDTVLKATIMKEWAQIKNSLADIPYFDGWDPIDLQDICMQSKIVNFSDGETILGDGFGVPNMSYFIAEGKAIMVQHLILVRKHTEKNSHSKWGPAIKCLPLGTKIEDGLGECVFIQIAEMEKGACFSLGEKLVDRRIVAQGPVKVMLVPLFALTSRNRGYLWSRIREFLDRRLPAQKELFLMMLNGRDWTAYTKQVRNSVPTRPGNHTCIRDVPLSYRAENDIPAMRYSAYTFERLDHPKKWQWILKRRQKLLQDAKIEAAKQEFLFDENFLKTFGEQARNMKKGKPQERLEEQEIAK